MFSVVQILTENKWGVTIPTGNIFPVSPFVQLFYPPIPLCPTLCSFHPSLQACKQQSHTDKITAEAGLNKENYWIPHMVLDFLVADSTEGSLAKTHGYYFSLILSNLLYEDLHVHKNYSCSFSFMLWCNTRQHSIWIQTQVKAWLQSISVWWQGSTSVPCTQLDLGRGTLLHPSDTTCHKAHLCLCHFGRVFAPEAQADSYKILFGFPSFLNVE